MNRIKQSNWICQYRDILTCQLGVASCELMFVSWELRVFSSFLSVASL